MKTALAVILLLLAPCHGAVADYNAGEAALHSGNFARALAELGPAAERGDARAQNALGLLYQNGWGVARDYVRAAEFYRQSGEQDYVRAQHNLALLYQAGLGVDRDQALAASWLKRAARRGYVASQSDLGFAYYAARACRATCCAPISGGRWQPNGWIRKRPAPVKASSS
jgi:TPR repeat protein